ncbi:MAG: hypothetical protein LKF79_06675 [Solobacterium sp.]|nr:hypothetical protein [Solobacterium sp.]MCH4222737.1 hypothetical protein [Solobacterium sp.]MCH4266309.1 hypothetical protein [Solobacterium sp.]
MKLHNLKLIVGFTALLSLILVVMTDAVTPKDNSPYGGTENSQNWGFLSEPSNSIDVYVVGNSNAGAAWSPMEAWKDQGMTSYVSAGPWQNIAQAYHLFTSAVKSQHPKVVVFETDELFTHKDNLGTSAIEETFPLLKYHDRWKQFKFSTLFEKTSYTYVYCAKGQTVRSTAKAYTGDDYMTADSGTETISNSYRWYLDRIVSDCKKEGIQLVLVEMPSASSWNMKRHNTVQQYADEHGLQFIDTNIASDSYKVNWTMDTRDGGDHLNWYGASKLTRYLSGVISTTYNTEDHRKDKAYSTEWNKDFALYLNEIKNNDGY